MTLLSVVLLCSTVATAVCVDGQLSVAHEYSKSTYVLIADVVTTHKVPESKDGRYLDGTNYTLRTIQGLKGHPPKTFAVFSENSSGRFNMVPRERYLVFVYRDGRLQIDNCGNSGPLNSSSDTLAKIQNLVKH